MKQKTALPQTLALFPLPGALLLPRARLPLQIFEPRYAAMVEACLKTPERMIGIIRPRERGAAEARPRPLHEIGCAGRLTAFTEHPNGRYAITLTGMSRFRIGREIESFAPYRRCEPRWEGFEDDLSTKGEDDPHLNPERLTEMLSRYLKMHEVAVDWEAIKQATPEVLINAMAILCPFSGDEKQALLEAPTLIRRREILTALLEFALHSPPDDVKVTQ